MLEIPKGGRGRQKAALQRRLPLREAEGKLICTGRLGQPEPEPDPRSRARARRSQAPRKQPRRGGGRLNGGRGITLRWPRSPSAEPKCPLAGARGHAAQGGRPLTRTGPQRSVFTQGK